MPCQKGRGGAKPGQRMVTVEGVRSGRPSGIALRVEISRSLNYNHRLTRVLSIPSRRILEASTKRGTIVTHQFHLPPIIEQTGVSSGDGATRQRAPIGDPPNNEQWSDHLPNPSSH